METLQEYIRRFPSIQDAIRDLQHGNPPSEILNELDEFLTTDEPSMEEIGGALLSIL